MFDDEGRPSKTMFYYIKSKHSKTLFDEEGRPNFHDDFVLYSKEEKERLYPFQNQQTEFELLKQQQERTDAAVQDLILIMMGGE